MSRIEFNELIIDNLSNVSGVFSGKNIQVEWKAVPKSNQGNGKITGDFNKFINTKNIINEREINLDEK